MEKGRYLTLRFDFSVVRAEPEHLYISFLRDLLPQPSRWVFDAVRGADSPGVRRAGPRSADGRRRPGSPDSGAEAAGPGANGSRAAASSISIWRRSTFVTPRHSRSDTLRLARKAERCPSKSRSDLEYRSVAVPNPRTSTQARLLTILTWPLRRRHRRLPLPN